MEYFYYIEAVLFIIGLFTAFISAVLSASSYTNSESAEQESFPVQQKSLKKYYDFTDSPFISLEIMAYSFSYFVLFYNIQEQLSNIIYAIYIFPIYFLITLSLRTVNYSLGVRFADKVINKFSSIIRIFHFLNYPFANILKNLGKGIIGETSDDMTLKELTAIVDNVCDEGTMGFGELKILKNIMRFREVFVSDIMTPRTVIFSLQSDATIGEVLDLPEVKMYSRIPLREGESLDDGVAGYIMTKDLYYAALKGKSNQPLKDLAREVHYVPENGELDIALDLFLKRKQHIFLVVDEYGGIEGLLTMEDVIETILGAEIVDEADKVVDLREFAKQRRDRRIAGALAQNEI